MNNVPYAISFQANYDYQYYSHIEVFNTTSGDNNITIHGNGKFIGNGSGLTQLSASNISGVLEVANGGIGVSSLTSGGLLLGNGTTGVTTVTGLNWTSGTTTLNVPGQIVATNDITAFSDERLKENIKKLHDVENVFNTISGYSFNWNKKGQELLNKSFDEVEIGLIAQEVQHVIPSAISFVEKEKESYLTLKYTKLIPYLVEGYKLLNDKYNKQQEQINEIKQLLQK